MLRHNVPVNNRDVVYTPRPLAKRIIDHFAPTGRVLEPCKGDGAFFDQFPDTCEKDWCEISLGRDFFDYNEKVDWIITNPPYSTYNEFLNHALSIADNVVFLIPFYKVFNSLIKMQIPRNHNAGIKAAMIFHPKETNFGYCKPFAAVHFCKEYDGPMEVIDTIRTADKEIIIDSPVCRNLAPGELSAAAFYAGTGGFSLGVENAGFKHILAVDFDKHAVQCYNQNFPETPIERWNMFEKSGDDVLQRLNIPVGELDLMHLEPPCQAISTAGRRNPNDKRNMLLLDSINIIDKVKPKAFSIENVDGLVQGDYLPVYYWLKWQLDSLKDYVWDFRIMNSLNFGAPTWRERFIVIGVRKDISQTVSFPEPSTINFDPLRIKNVCPWIKWVHSGYGFNKLKRADGFMNTITKTRNIMVTDTDNRKRFLTTEEILMFNGFPLDWKLAGDSAIKKWARIGNAVPPPLAYAISKHIKDTYF